MKVLLHLFFFMLILPVFSQNHSAKINDYLEYNKFKELINYCEENELTKTDGYRYEYWAARLALNYGTDASDLKEEALKDAPDNSETEMIKYSFEYHYLHNLDYDPDEKMKKTGMELEKYIDAVNKKDPFYAKLNVLFCAYLMEMGYYSEAAKRAKIALKTNPKEKNANLIYGYSIILANSDQKGVDYIEKELKIHPNNADAYWILGDIVEFTKGFCNENCLKYKGLAAEKSPQELEYFVYFITALSDEGLYEAVINNINEYIGEYDHPIVHYLLADAYSSMEDYENSNRICDQLLKKDPNDDKVLYVKTTNMIMTDQLDKALQLALKLNTIDPNEPVYKYVLAEIYYYQDETGMAVDLCEKEIKDSSEYAMFYLLVSDIAFEEGEDVKGIKYFQMASDQEDFWDELLDYQIVQYLESVFDDMPKNTFNETVKAIEQGYYGENKQCLVDYYHYKKNDPQQLDKMISKKCKDFVESGAQ